MDAMERRDVATCDLPCYFLQIDMEEYLLLRVNGSLVILLIKLDQKSWNKHLRHGRKNAVIYVSCDKIIYGTVTAALLSYKKSLGHLMDWGFEMNSYKPCCWDILKRHFTMKLWGAVGSQ